VVQRPKPHTTSATIVTSTKQQNTAKGAEKRCGKEAQLDGGIGLGMGMHKCRSEATKMANGMRAGPRAIH